MYVTDKFFCILLYVGAYGKGKVVLFTRDNMVCRSAIKLALGVLVFQGRNNLIACIALLVGITCFITLQYISLSKLCLTFCCRTKIADF